jgi:tetratricopeptide (TPR) repeat protein
MFDTYEHTHPIVNEWLLTYLLGHSREMIECDLRLVIARRVDLLTTDERWAQQWADHILALPLEPFTQAEIADFAKKHNTPAFPSSTPATGPDSDNRPVWFNVAQVSGATLPLNPADLPTLFTDTQRDWLTQAALLGTFNQRRLTALLGSDEGRTAFKWLVSQPCLIRPSSVSGQFILDRTLAETLLKAGEAAESTDPQTRQLLEYLDRELDIIRQDLQRPKTHRTTQEYQALLLERLAHTLPSDSAAATPFIQASFLEALDKTPPLMFDILALIKRAQDSSAEATPYHTLAAAWLAGQWAQMAPLLAEMAADGHLNEADRGRAYHWWGYSYSAQGQPEKALEIYDRGLALQSESPALRFARGLAHFDRGHYEAAIGDFSQALTPQPAKAQQAVIYHTRGLACAHLADYSEAIDDFSQVIRLDPDNGAAYSDRGLAFGQQGQQERAIEDYTQAIRLNPQDAAAYFQRGLARTATDQAELEKAIEDYSRAIELRPT